MTKDDRPAIALDDEDDDRVHATWSRKGRLIVTVGDTRFADVRQVTLHADQVEALVGFLLDGPDRAGA